MKNKEHNKIIESHNNRLIRIDAQKRLIEKMIKDLEKQFSTLSDEWDETWRSRQYYINREEEESSDPMDDYN
jgi:predicted nuclease with TOPRIM domain